MCQDGSIWSRDFFHHFMTLCMRVVGQAVICFDCPPPNHPTCCIHSLALSPKIEPSPSYTVLDATYPSSVSPTAPNSFYCYSIFGFL